MSRTRQLIYCFWIFVVVMLLWQCYRYNQSVTEVDAQHPRQEHFFYYHSNANAQVEAPVKDAPDVRQTGFDHHDSPGGGGFTCEVTLQNKGRVKAVNVQVQVCPYKGVHDDDQGSLAAHHADNSSTLGQISQWVNFPDLAPGQSSTQSVVFTKTGSEPGSNPSPQITFEAAKP